MPTDSGDVDAFLLRMAGQLISELARRHGEDGLFHVVLHAAMAARHGGLAEVEIVQPLLGVAHHLSPVGRMDVHEVRTRTTPAEGSN
jgi:hypothetical protein